MRDHKSRCSHLRGTLGHVYALLFAAVGLTGLAAYLLLRLKQGLPPVIVMWAAAASGLSLFWGF